MIYSRTERCAEIEKKKIININILPLLLNYLNQVLEFLTLAINNLSISSKTALVICFILFFFKKQLMNLKRNLSIERGE